MDKTKRKGCARIPYPNKSAAVAAARSRLRRSDVYAYPELCRWGRHWHLVEVQDEARAS